MIEFTHGDLPLCVSLRNVPPMEVAERQPFERITCKHPKKLTFWEFPHHWRHWGQCLDHKNIRQNQNHTQPGPQNIHWKDRFMWQSVSWMIPNYDHWRNVIGSSKNIDLSRAFVFSGILYLKPSAIEKPMNWTFWPRSSVFTLEYSFMRFSDWPAFYQSISK